jgi:hypothetical protein
MLIADSQVHLWGADTPERRWPPGRAADAQKPYPIGKEARLFQMDLAGVRRVVIVPPSWEGDRNDLALEAARAYPDRFAVMGRLSLGDPASPELVAGWRCRPAMRSRWSSMPGTRIMIGTPARSAAGHSQSAVPSVRKCR